ncbi:peptidase domain-containing ABC transporter [Teredinibacter turnerae]|uniref:peptidase domain-containing ABC transporter n=1 Tax=Teredinibacter turnerae TaxID=2426 RepID=UPI0003FFECEF|nr:peptidase domain-containing ABC transporter [Teredinibacter turnerae]
MFKLKYFQKQPKGRMKYLKERLSALALFNRLPMIYQVEHADCGVACLHMLLEYHGVKIRELELREHFPGIARGTSFYNCIKVAQKYGFSGSAYEADSLEDVSQQILPCIANWGRNHFVVLKRRTREGIIIHDPSEGVKTVSEEAFNRQFSGHLLAVKDDNKNNGRFRGDRPLLCAINNIREILKEDINLKSGVTMLLLMSAALCMFALGAPYYGKIVFDTVVSGSNKQVSSIILYAFLAIIATEALIRYLKSVFVLRFSSYIALSLSSGVYRRLLSLPFMFFQGRNNADILSRINSAHSIREAVTSSVVTIVIDVMLVTASIAVILTLSKALTFFIVVAASLYAAICAFMLLSLQDMTKAALVVKARQDAIVLETIQAISLIKVANIADRRAKQYRQKVLETLSIDARLGYLFVRLTFFEAVVISGQSVILLYLAADIALNQGMSLGDVFMMAALNNRIFSSAKSLVNNTISLAQAKAHLERLSDIVEPIPYKHHTYKRPTRSHNQKLSTAGSQNDHSIVGRGLSFFYGGSKQPVFSALSFDIPPNEITVITGPSGCGKSTLLNCLIGLVQPNEGSITVGGKSIFDNPDYSQNISAVLQSDRLLEGSVLDNITLFDENPDMEAVRKAAVLACIHDIIDSLLMGYDTPIKDIHSTLSAGQSQRIMLARSLYRSPSYLFLDEATCNLDESTERRFYANLESVRATKIIVAHRQAAIDMAGNRISLDISKNWNLSPANEERLV